MTQKKSQQPKAATAPEAASKFDDIENEGLRLALKAAKSRAKLGQALGVSRQGVAKWSEVPPRFAPIIEKLYKIPRKKIAPDLY